MIKIIGEMDKMTEQRARELLLKATSNRLRRSSFSFGSSTVFDINDLGEEDSLELSRIALGNKKSSKQVEVNRDMQQQNKLDTITNKDNYEEEDYPTLEKVQLRRDYSLEIRVQKSNSENGFRKFYWGKPKPKSYRH